MLTFRTFGKRGLPNVVPVKLVDYRNQFVLAFEFALQSVWRARRRMVLAILGIGIGFGAIHTMLILGSSAEARIRASLDSLGGDIVTISVTRRPSESTRSLKALATQHTPPPLDGVSFKSAMQLIGSMPLVESFGWAENDCHGNSPEDSLYELHRIPVGVQQMLLFKAAAGRLLHEGDRSQGNIVLGADAFLNLRLRQPDAGLGTVVLACGQRLRIVGVLQRHLGNDLIQAFNINQSALKLGTETDQRQPDDTRYILVKLRNESDSRGEARQIRARLLLLMPGSNAVTTAAWDVIRLRQEQTALYSRFLAVLGSVSLLVGALGIANMMLVSVAERKAEIGLRMTIGARQSDIVLQFVIESVLICLVSSAAGLLAGIATAQVALKLSGFELVLPLAVALQATLLALVCGIAAGAYPAFRAASVDPNQCLKN